MSPKVVICPVCRVREVLQPGPKFSYLDMWVNVSKRHQDQGCARWNYAHWGFDPLWDNQEPQTIRDGRKMRLVWHPDGYHMTVPAEWDEVRRQAFFDVTRQKKRGRA